MGKYIRWDINAKIGTVEKISYNSFLVHPPWFLRFTFLLSPVIHQKLAECDEGIWIKRCGEESRFVDTLRRQFDIITEARSLFRLQLKTWGGTVVRGHPRRKSHLSDCYNHAFNNVKTVFLSVLPYFVLMLLYTLYVYSVCKIHQVLCRYTSRVYRILNIHSNKEFNSTDRIKKIRQLLRGKTN